MQDSNKKETKADHDYAA